MIGYITLGTNNLERSAKFYDTLLSKGFDAKRQMEEEKFITWGTEEAPSQIAVIKPFNNGPATVSNGGMVSLMLNSKEAVDEFYKTAIELGASDEGKPGPRESAAFYASYFRDLDGNKLCAFFFDKSLS
ncbi:glyoxalase [Halobacteriovorax marinus]|uniref:Glyoxalase n=1 Tax=Halobacteriovorax marinus TaxID=97084 RepID=A0A1Y5F874_9BACT|nr:glyoxalase [Halobacteriovorax marinus]